MEKKYIRMRRKFIKFLIILSFLSMINGGYKTCISSACVLSDEEQLAASIRLSDKGDLRGDDNLLRREFYMTGDGNCALYAMGSTYPDVKNLFLANSNNLVVRDLAHQEIIDEFNNLPRQMKEKQEYINLKKALDNTKALLREKNLPADFRKEIFEEADRLDASIAIYAKSKEAYEDYVNYALIDGHYMHFREDVEGCEATYFIDALAYLLNKNLTIWSHLDPNSQYAILGTRPKLITQHNKQLICSHSFIKNDGNDGTLELIRRNQHYNRIVPIDNQGALIKAEQDEEISIARTINSIEEQQQAQLFSAKEIQQQAQILATIQKEKAAVEQRAVAEKAVAAQKKEAEEDARQKQIREEYDKQFFEAHLLPRMKQFVGNHPTYQNYESFSKGQGTGYAQQQGDLRKIWTTYWQNRQWSNQVDGIFPDFYNPPITVVQTNNKDSH